MAVHLSKRSIPNTAGRILSEAELRAYLKCSEYYSFGGKFEPILKLKITRRTIEKLISIHLRNNTQDSTYILSKTILEGARKYGAFSTLLEPQVNQLINDCALVVNDFFQQFPLSTYTIVTGPLPIRVRVSKTPIDLRVSGTFRTKKNKTLHVLDFSPYSRPHAMRWDLTAHLKLKHLKQVVVPHQSRRTDAMIHLFGLSEGSKKFSSTLLGSEQLDETLIERSEYLIQNVERGYHMPLVPCPYACPYKKTCEP